MNGVEEKKPGLATHYLRYSTSNALAILASLVSFPILTRLLDTTQYGILGYFDTWVLMAVAVGKLGAQHAILRFYPHADEGQLPSFTTNIFYVPLLLSMLLWILAASGMIVFDVVDGVRQSAVFWMALATIPVTVFINQAMTMLRAMEQSGKIVLLRIMWRWVELALMLAAVAFIQRSAVAAYAGKLATALLVLVWFLWWARRHLVFEPASLSPSYVREGLVYGLPLVANEIVAVAMISLDRLMLKGMLQDFAAVGVYSIGMSLAMQVNVFTNGAVFEAFTPMANRLFLTQGAESVRELKARMLMPMTYAACGAAVLLGCFGTDIIIALSGADKAAAGPVLGVAGIIFALQPLLLVAGYGLLLERRSTKILGLMCAALAVNGVLNYLWIPAYGVMGSVYATAVSSFVLGAAHCVFVPRSLLRFPDIRTVAISLLASASAAALAWMLAREGLGQGWPRLIVGGASVGACYAIVVLALDSRQRDQLRQWLSSRRRTTGA